MGCEEDMLENYLGLYASCDAEWKSAVACGTTATYDTLSECQSVNPGSLSSSPDEPCKSEKLALKACANGNDPWTSVTGSQATCSYGPGVLAPCEISCPVGANTFSLSCTAKPGLPMQCGCAVNGSPIQDWFPSANIYAADCADAASLAANGVCTNRLNCCFEYNDGQKDVCTCGSDPSLLGYPSCQAAADFAGGKVVDICPKYAPNTGGCWPPARAGSFRFAKRRRAAWDPRRTDNQPEIQRQIASPVGPRAGLRGSGMTAESRPIVWLWKGNPSTVRA